MEALPQWRHCSGRCEGHSKVAPECGRLSLSQEEIWWSVCKVIEERTAKDKKVQLSHQLTEHLLLVRVSVN
jgi:hypothetical protein